MKPWTENYLKSISEIEAHQEKLSGYERGYVDSLRRQIAREIAVSSYQSRLLEKIWKRVVA